MIIQNKGKMFDFITKTWNPIAMRCPHQCVYCWSEALKNGKLKNTKKYQNLTVDTPRLIERELHRTFSKDDFVFVEDMGDLFAITIPNHKISAVLDFIRTSPAKFLLLTKNPERMLEKLRSGAIPENTILGVTLESDIDYLNISKAINQSLRQYYFGFIAKELQPQRRLFLSLEPILKFTTSLERYLWGHRESIWAVAIGYDNYKHNLPEPPLSEVKQLISKMDQYIPNIYVKTLRESADESDYMF